MRPRLGILALLLGPIVSCQSSLNLPAEAPIFQPARGVLDESFGIGGKAVLDVSHSESHVMTSAIRTDGEILLGGHAQNATLDFALSLLKTDGTLDTSFGSSGSTFTDFAANTEEVKQLLLLPDNGFYAVGWSQDVSTSHYSLALAQYDAQGNLVTSFGMGGKVVTNFGASDFIGYSGLLQPDGKIVACGGYTAVGVGRFNSDGSLDTSFGSGGFFTSVGPGNINALYACVLQPDGKILAAGLTYYSGSAVHKALILRLTPEGALDTSFGNSGVLAFDFGQGSAQGGGAGSLALQSDGKILMGGIDYLNEVVFASTSNFGLARLLPDGSFDASFGTNGKVSTDFGHEELIRGLVLQPDGKIVACGESDSGTDFSSPSVFATARYNTDGSLDTSFGTDGKVTTSISGYDYPSGVALDPTGLIVVSGASKLGSYNVFTAARYR